MSTAILFLDKSKGPRRFVIKRPLQGMTVPFIKEIQAYYLQSYVNQKMENYLWYVANFLKEQGITCVYLTKDVDALPHISILKEEFKFFYGELVIKYLFYDILKKYCEKEGILAEEMVPAFIGDDPFLIKNYIDRVYNKVKAVKIITRKEESFESLAQYYLKEYGFPLLINEKKESKDVDISLKEEIKQGLTIQNISCEFFQHTFNYQLKDVMPFNEKLLEFLVYHLYGNVSYDTIEQLFCQYLVKLTKIKNKD